MPRKLTHALACISLLFPAEWAPGAGKDHTPPGVSWKRLPSNEKLMYMAGYWDGYVEGSVDGSKLSYAVVMKAAQETHSGCNVGPLSHDEMRNLIEPEMKEFILLSDSVPTVESAVEATSVFYEDYRNLPVCWKHAAYFAVASLAGRARGEQELAAARKADAESQCGAK